MMVSIALYCDPEGMLDQEHANMRERAWDVSMFAAPVARLVLHSMFRSVAGGARTLELGHASMH